jgi:transposase
VLAVCLVGCRGRGAHPDDSRERSGQLGKGKTDPVDALAIARITAREPQLPPLRLTIGPAADLRALLDYREDLVVERGALVNRAHAELSGLRAGYHYQVPDLTTRARVRVVLTLIAYDGSVRAVLCRRRLERILAIDAETAELKRQIVDLVAAANTTLTDLYGIGPLVAARFIAEVVDVRRYPDRNAFAAANGAAPLPASSGRTVRHRFNPGGTGNSTARSTPSRSPKSAATPKAVLVRTQTGGGQTNAKPCAA